MCDVDIAIQVQILYGYMLYTMDISMIKINAQKGLKKIHVGHIVYRKKATFFLQMIKSIKSEFINYNSLNLNEHIFELHEMFLDEF